MLRSSALLALLAASALLAAPVQSHASDPFPPELRSLAYEMVGGPVGGFEPSFADPAFSTADDDGEPVDVFDFGSIAPLFASGPGGRGAFGLGFADATSGSVRALNFGRLSFGTTRTERRRDTFAGATFEGARFESARFGSARFEGLGFGPNSFEETAAIENAFTAFANYDFVNDRTKRFGFDFGVTQRTFRANGFTQEEVSTEVGASFSADVQLSSRLFFTGRAGINLSDEATRAHLDTTANKATTSAGGLSVLETETGLKDAYVQGGLSFSVTKHFEIDATLGYARDLDTKDDALLGKIGAAWKIRF